MLNPATHLRMATSAVLLQPQADLTRKRGGGRRAHGDKWMLDHLGVARMRRGPRGEELLAVEKDGFHRSFRSDVQKVIQVAMERNPPILYYGKALTAKEQLALGGGALSVGKAVVRYDKEGLRTKPNSLTAEERTERMVRSSAYYVKQRSRARHECKPYQEVYDGDAFDEHSDHEVDAAMGIVRAAATPTAAMCVSLKPDWSAAKAHHHNGLAAEAITYVYAPSEVHLHPSAVPHAAAVVERPMQGATVAPAHMHWCHGPPVPMPVACVAHNTWKATTPCAAYHRPPNGPSAACPAAACPAAACPAARAQVMPPESAALPCNPGRCGAYVAGCAPGCCAALGAESSLPPGTVAVQTTYLVPAQQPCLGAAPQPGGCAPVRPHQSPYLTSAWHPPYVAVPPSYPTLPASQALPPGSLNLFAPPHAVASAPGAAPVGTMAMVGSGGSAETTDTAAPHPAGKRARGWEGGGQEQRMRPNP